MQWQSNKQREYLRKAKRIIRFYPEPQGGKERFAKHTQKSLGRGPPPPPRGGGGGGTGDWGLTPTPPQPTTTSTMTPH